VLAIDWGVSNRLRCFISLVDNFFSNYVHGIVIKQMWNNSKFSVEHTYVSICIYNWMKCEDTPGHPFAHLSDRMEYDYGIVSIISHQLSSSIPWMAAMGLTSFISFLYLALWVNNLVQSHIQESGTQRYKTKKSIALHLRLVEFQTPLGV